MLKKHFLGLQKKVGKIFSILPIHPNHITILSVIFAIIGAYFVFEKNNIGLVFILFAFLFDGLDGAIARAKNLSTAFGAYLDGISDRLVEFFAIAPLILDPQYTIPSVLILFFGTCMTSFSKSYADHRGICDAKTAANMKTILSRTERVLAVFVVLGLYLQGVVEVNYLLWAIAIVSIVSFIKLQFEAYNRRQ